MAYLFPFLVCGHLERKPLYSILPPASSFLPPYSAGITFKFLCSCSSFCSSLKHLEIMAIIIVSWSSSCWSSKWAESSNINILCSLSLFLSPHTNYCNLGPLFIMTMFWMLITILKEETQEGLLSCSHCLFKFFELQRKKNNLDDGRSHAHARFHYDEFLSRRHKKSWSPTFLGCRPAFTMPGESIPSFLWHWVLMKSSEDDSWNHFLITERKYREKSRTQWLALRPVFVSSFFFHWISFRTGWQDEKKNISLLILIGKKSIFVLALRT